MAKDVITRFKLETTGFDSKIKEAAKELSAYSKTATQAKEGFNQFTKANVDAARALGTMATSTTNVKDRAKELVGAFNDAAKAYNALSDEQKQSDWAKALSGSLTQLQQRIKETKTEMQGLGDSMKGGGGLFSGIGSKMEGALAVFGGNLMTKAAGAVAQLGSEMYGMVQQGIEMARAGEGVRIAFERLGRGDILDGLRQATHGTVTDLELMKAAVKFNDFKLPVEELGTMLAFAQQKAKDTGQSVDYMVDSIVTGLGRKSLMILDNLGLSANEIKEKMKQTGDMTKAVGQIIREQMAKAGDYVETAADRAAQANVSLQNKMEELGRKFAPVEEASNQLWTSMKIGILDIIGGPLARLLNGLTEAGRLQNAINNMNGGVNGGPTRIDRMVSMLGDGKSARSRNTYNKQLGVFDERINQQQFRIASLSGKDAITRGLRQKAETELKALEAMRAEYISRANDVFNAKPGTITTGGGKDDKKKNTKTEQTELQKNQSKINELTQQFIDINAEASRAGKPLTEEQKKQTEEIQKQIEKLKERNGLLGLFAEQAQGRLTLGAGDFQRDELSNTPGTLLKAPTTAVYENGVMTEKAVPAGGLQLDDKAMRAVTKDIYKNSQKEQNKNLSKEQAIEGMSDLIGGVNNVFGGLQQMGIEIPQEIRSVTGVLNGILTVVMGIESIITVGQFLGIFHNGGIVPGFANGGTISHAANGYFVGGTHYSGDVTPIMANAGELVLNKAQQGNLANQLQGGGIGDLNLTATIRGEQIRLALNNNGRRTGRGEYVQSNKR